MQTPKMKMRNPCLLLSISNRSRPVSWKEYDVAGYRLQFLTITRPQKVKWCERGASRSVPDLLKNGGPRGESSSGRFDLGNQSKPQRKVETPTGRRELHIDSQRERERERERERRQGTSRDDGLSSYFFSLRDEHKHHS
jgi:hypothetical protein